MIRRIIEIDREKCNGCGACAAACHEGAIGMVDGVATLLRDDYCDGLGDCLPTCPTGAIRFVEREALAYDEAAVKENMKKSGIQNTHACPGAAAKKIERVAPAATTEPVSLNSQLGQWPCQIKLMPITAPYYEGAKLLIAADCSAYAYANMHNEFMKDKITVIGCPKLDNVAYAEKLTAIIKNNNIQSVTIVRMEVPCCGGLEMAAKKALQDSGKFIPWQVFTITTDGRIKEQMMDQTYNKLFGALIGVARSIDWYAPIEKLSMDVILKVLSTVASSKSLLDETAVKALTKELHLEKYRLVPDCFTCMNRCGRTDDYDMELLWNAGEDIRTAKLELLEKILEMSKEGSASEEQDRYYVKALISLGEAYDADTLNGIRTEM